MINIINIDQEEEWDSFIRGFKHYDVYYLSGYVKAFQKHGDGVPMLICFSNDENKAACVMMKRDVADDPLFAGSCLPPDKYTDLITPYGYGGFIFDSPTVSSQTIHLFCNELMTFLKDNGFISAFFRFHPLLNNSGIHTECADVIDLGKTVAMNLSSEDSIWQDIISKNRNMIRKAEKSGVIIKHGKGIELLRIFKEIYDETMAHDNADKYYFFNEAFYKSIDQDLNDNYEIFYAEYNGVIISMSIIIFADAMMNYHLSGSRYEYRSLAPSNLLLYKAALWGYENGYKTFHLGGGVGSGEDNLYKFKAAFNRNSDCRFSIGKMIIDRTKYQKLLSMRGFSDTESESISFFPAYRAS